MAPAITDRLDTLGPSQQAAAGGVLVDRQLKYIVCAPLVGATVLSKFSIPPLGAQGFGLIFPIIFGALLCGVFTSRLQFAWRRLVIFGVMLSLLGMVQVLRGDLFSLSSVILMAALGFSYVLTGHQVASRGSFDTGQMLEFFCNLTFFIAAAGIVQAILLLIGGPALGFPIENLVPEAFLTQGYNNITPLFYGSPTYKANGFFMLEPSVFSQLTAIGLIAELSYRTRLVRIAVYAGAMIVAYSGTGMLILAVALPLYIVVYRRWELLIPAALIVSIAALLAEPLQLNVLMNRTGEFDRVGTSGFARFVAWRELFADRLWNSPAHALFGHGAGSFVSGSVGYSAAQMSYSKIIFEFGVLGSLLYFAFIFYCIFSSRAPLMVRIAVTVCYFLNGAYSPTVTGIALSVLLWPGGQIRPVDKQIAEAALPVPVNPSAGRHAA